MIFRVFVKISNIEHKYLSLLLESLFCLPVGWLILLCVPWGWGNLSTGKSISWGWQGVLFVIHYFFTDSHSFQADEDQKTFRTKLNCPTIPKRHFDIFLFNLCNIILFFFFYNSKLLSLQIYILKLGNDRDITSRF